MIFKILNLSKSYNLKLPSLYLGLKNVHLFQTALQQPVKCCCLPAIRKFSNARALDINTKVVKDVMLFKYDNPKFYKYLNVFGVCQFLFWTYLSHFAYTTLKDAPVLKVDDSDLPWYRRMNLGDNKYRNAITAICFLIGYGVLAASWFYTLRSVRFLVLRKNGNEVSFVTYGPFGKNRIMTVPLNCVSANESREAAKVQLPVKVKDKAFFYILDMKGEFTNKKLYDYTVGMRRNLD